MFRDNVSVSSRILTPEDRSSLLILLKFVESFGDSVYSKYFGNAFSLSAHTYTYEHASNGDKKSEISVRMTDEFLSAVLRVAIPALTPRCGDARQFWQPTPSVALIR
jgi:hypothetical protein